MTMKLQAIVAFTLIVTESLVSAFVTPTSFQQQLPITISRWPSHFNVLSAPSLLLNDALPISETEAFTDEIDLFGDPTIQLLLVGFGVVVTLAIGAKLYLNQMDEAIEKVLVEFENTMKGKYPSRWVSMEAKLDGLVEPERSQRLFAIMEELQASEPQFMAKVNSEMGT